MDDRKYKKFVVNFISILKEKAFKVKNDVTNSKAEIDNYDEGQLMAYTMIFSLLKMKASFIEKDIGLADFDPEIDLLEIRYADQNEENDNTLMDSSYCADSESYHIYLCDSIQCLKEQAMEAKLKAINPKLGYENYSKGWLMAYHSTFEIIKNLASSYNIKETELNIVNVDLLL